MSKIEWTDKTWNPITGCTPIGEGCRNCYAKRMATRLAGRYGYPKDDPFRVTFHPDKLDEPLKWKKPCRVFVCSMGDLFHSDVSATWRNRIFRVIQSTPRHEYVVLTKRPERAAGYMHAVLITRQWPPDDIPFTNVTLGVSCWDQESADQMIPVLLETPAARRIVSLEPLLGAVDIGQFFGCTCDYVNGNGDEQCTGQCFYYKNIFTKLGNVHLDGVIVGGESGPGARPMHPDWARSVRDQCVDAGVPFFFKQWGEWWPAGKRLLERNDMIGFGGESMYPVGKKDAGRLLDGEEWNEWPEARREGNNG